MVVGQSAVASVLHGIIRETSCWGASRPCCFPATKVDAVPFFCAMLKLEAHFDNGFTSAPYAGLNLESVEHCDGILQCRGVWQETRRCGVGHPGRSFEDS